MFGTLIVEDDHVLCGMLSEALRRRFPGMTVSTARDGTEALTRLGERAQDLVITDVRLPGRSGFDITRQIKRQPGRTTVLVLTSHDLPEYRNTALACGADHFMVKGAVSMEEILRLVQSLVIAAQTA
jgi:two-component system OmpR family response regulator